MSFAAPITTSTAMPIVHARCASPVATKAGPTTPKVSANSDGVSMPKGIAHTSCRRSRRARRNASHPYARSPTSTPIAVPGTMRPSTRSAGMRNTPMRMPAIAASIAKLSIASAKKPLTSPRPNQR